MFYNNSEAKRSMSANKQQQLQSSLFLLDLDLCSNNTAVHLQITPKCSRMHVAVVVKWQEEV